MRQNLKGFIVTAMTAGMFAGMAWSPSAYAQTVRKLTYATYNPDTFAMTKADVWFMNEVTLPASMRATAKWPGALPSRALSQQAPAPHRARR